MAFPVPQANAVRKSSRWLALLLFAASLGIYLSFLSPSLGLGDAAEYALCVHQLRLTHPPGRCVYIWLGKLFSLLPVGGLPYRLNLMSAVFASAGLSALYFLLRHLNMGRGEAAAGALIFGLSPVFWTQAERTETYSMLMLFLVLLLLLLCRWTTERKPRWFYLLGFTYGMALGVHGSLILYLPAFLFYLVRHRALLVRPRREIGLVLLSFGAPVIVQLLWYFFRARDYPPLGTQYVPDTVRELLLYLSAREAGSFHALVSLQWLGRVPGWGLILLFNFTGLGVFFGLWGLVEIARRDRPLFYTLLLIAGINSLYFLSWTRQMDWKDIDSYVFFLPTNLVFSILITGGVVLFARRLRRPGRLARKPYSLSTPLLLVVVGVQVGFFLLPSPGGDPAASPTERGRWRLMRQTLRQHAFADEGAEQLARYYLASLEEPAAVAIAWDMFPVLLYCQQVRGDRPEVPIFELTPDRRTYLRWGYRQKDFNFILSRELEAGRTVYLADAPDYLDYAWRQYESGGSPYIRTLKKRGEEVETTDLRP